MRSTEKKATATHIKLQKVRMHADSLTGTDDSVRPKAVKMDSMQILHTAKKNKTKTLALNGTECEQLVSF